MLAALAPGLCPRAAAPQIVSGFVVDSTTAERLVSTSLILFDTLQRPVATGFAGEDGAFVLRAPRAGIYRLSARRLGYDHALIDRVDLREERSISLLLRLTPKAIALPALTVEAKRVERRLEEEGFYQRMRMGIGHFVTPEMIARRNPFFVTDLLRNMAGVRVVYSMGRPTGVVLRGGDLMFDGRSCAPVVLVDGVIRRGDLNDLVSADDIAAAEVYPGAVGMPVQVGGLEGSCGAVVLWTKR